MITRVLPADRRLPEWSDNVGQTDRRVLYINSAFRVLPWDEWLSLGGHKRVMGTHWIVSCKDQMLTALLSADVTADSDSESDSQEKKSSEAA